MWYRLMTFMSEYGEETLAWTANTGGFKRRESTKPLETTKIMIATALINRAMRKRPYISVSARSRCWSVKRSVRRRFLGKRPEISSDQHPAEK
jgi:hypothetical protein